MKYFYEFQSDPFGDNCIVLSEEMILFSDFIENISTKDHVDEYVGYARKVFEGTYKDFEIELNAVNILIKKDVTIVENNFRIDEPYRNMIETDQFIELLLIWRGKIIEQYKE